MSDKIFSTLLPANGMPREASQSQPLIRSLARSHQHTFTCKTFPLAGLFYAPPPVKANRLESNELAFYLYLLTTLDYISPFGTTHESYSLESVTRRRKRIVEEANSVHMDKSKQEPYGDLLGKLL